MYSRVQSKGYGTKKGNEPKGCYYPDGPLQPWHGVEMQGMTNGQVPFRGKGHNCQHWHVRWPAKLIRKL